MFHTLLTRMAIATQNTVEEQVVTVTLMGAVQLMTYVLNMYVGQLSFGQAVEVDAQDSVVPGFTFQGSL